MPQLKEQNGRYYQEAEVVMLATKEYHSDIELDETLQLSKHKGYCNKNGQQLYIVSNEEIKEDDWYYSKTLDSIYQAIYLPLAIKDAKKIIATTDESLHIPFVTPGNEELEIYEYSILPKPSDSFISKYIEEYNAGRQITKVLVEYEKSQESINYHKDIFHNIERLKIDSNNSITIKKVKDSYSRE